MRVNPSLLMVPFSEVRHFQPDDCAHWETLDVRGRLHGWETPAHRHDALVQFEWLQRGAAVATIDGVRHELQAPAAWMIPPRVMHSYCYEPDSSGAMISVPTEFLNRSLGARKPVAHERERAILVSAPDKQASREMAALFEQFGREFKETRAGRADALQALAVLLAIWFVRHGQPVRAASPEHDLRDALVQRYKRLLDSHVGSHWPVSRYAQSLGVSVDHLSRTCRAVTGLGALELLHERLILEARRLLVYTPHSITAIAEQLGYPEPEYFSRFFSKRTGRSPSDYRKAAAAGVSAYPEMDTGRI